MAPLVRDLDILIPGAAVRQAEIVFDEFKLYDDDDSDVSLFGSSSASLHTKAFTVDDRAGFIGSMNFDPRSVSLNFEMGVVLEHAGLVKEVRAVCADEPLCGRAIPLASRTARSYGRTMRPSPSGFCARSRKRASGAG